MEGALRAPFMIRWPGRVAAGRVSNEIVHVTDLYVTLARIAGARTPSDRPVDGIDQLDFFTGRQPGSPREGFVYYIKQELRAAKWRNWKMHLVWEPEPNAGPRHLETPWIFNLLQDPKEETDVGNQHSWVRRPLRVLIHDFQQSLKAHPPIPPGAPDDYVPEPRTQGS
jgi:arylsulfatase